MARPASPKTKKKTLVQVLLEEDLVDALDSMRKTQPDLPTRPEMLRRLIAITHPRSPRRA